MVTLIWRAAIRVGRERPFTTLNLQSRHVHKSLDFLISEISPHSKRHREREEETESVSVSESGRSRL